MGFCLCSLDKELYSKKIKQFIIEEIIEKNKALGLKIHICGNTIENADIISGIFNEELKDIKYQERAELQYKTNQFYWIAKNYPNISEETINTIVNEIVDDIDKCIESKPITQQVILCFGIDNIQSLFDKIKKKTEIYFPLFIIISEEKDTETIKKIKFKDKRRITNIILNDKTRNKIKSKIISTLWKYDCYYNERGNKICRYTPDSIFKSFDIDLPFYSINILLTGKSKAGKSTFINYLSNKLNALESCKKESVSKNITEYCFYINNNNDNNTRRSSCIRIFDSPGILSNIKENTYIDKKKNGKNIADKKDNKIDENINNKSIEILSNLLNPEINNMDMQIHFILFFFMEGDSLEGIDEIFELLNKYGKRVLFVINKATSDDEDEKSKDIKATISFLTQRNFNNLIDENNYFGVNILRTNNFKDFGVNDIFKRIHELFIENNKFNENNNEIKKDMTDLCEKYKKLYVNPNENQIDEDNFKEEVNKLKNKLNEKYDMFKYINIEKIKKRGIISSNICRNLINSLGNLSKIPSNIEGNEKIPSISYFQAFMVREIGEIFGFNLDEIDKKIKDHLNKEIFHSDLNFFNNNNEKEKKKIKPSLDIITNYIKSEFEKSNKNFIIELAKMFNEFRENEKENKKRDDDDENIIDKNLTNEIFIETIDYFIKILENSNGLFFWKNYLNICQQLEKDLKFFSELDYNKHWGNKEMIIIDD